jgi:hypothetical protein
MHATLYRAMGKTSLMTQTERTQFLPHTTGILQSETMTGSTHAFVASPEIVTALAMAGTIAFNPTQIPKK